MKLTTIYALFELKKHKMSPSIYSSNLIQPCYHLLHLLRIIILFQERHCVGEIERMLPIFHLELVPFKPICPFREVQWKILVDK